MSNELEIGFPEMRYDITMPFFERRVKIDGVALKPAKTTSMVFEDNPKLREGDFGLCDLNLGYFLPAIDAGWELIGLPVFSKRKPVYPYIFCRADRGIDSPKDLEGKTIGTRQYRTAISVLGNAQAQNSQLSLWSEMARAKIIYWTAKSALTPPSYFQQIQFRNGREAGAIPLIP